MRSGIDTEGRDLGIRPQDDLFGYVNGGWIARTQIPEDRAMHGTSTILDDLVQRRLRTILESATKAEAAPGAVTSKLGDLYASFMAEQQVEKLGVEPLRAELDEIATIGDIAQLFEVSAHLARTGIVGAMNMCVDSAARDASRYLVHLEQGGLGLPDESYYRDDSRAELRDAYLAHIARMFTLAGTAQDQGSADRAAGHVVALETRLAAGHWDAVRSRDAAASDNVMSRVDLARLAPRVPWDAWISGWRGPAGAFDEVVVRQPDFLSTLSAALAEVSLSEWKTWLSWHVIRHRAEYLCSALVAEHFDFYGRNLTGTLRQRPRWQRAITLVNSALGEAAGRLYVEQHFPPQHKEQVLTLVKNLLRAYAGGISDSGWMGPATKQRALEKLSQITIKVGYPDAWRDYSALVIHRDDLLNNVHVVNAFATDRQLGKIDLPVDRGEWFMPPQTVSAYYNDGTNEITFPAGILQPPLFDMAVDAAVNYGAIGSIIGHEIGHAFDDQGSRYDGAGNLVGWWTPQDRANFDERAGRLIEQYAAFSPRQLPGTYHVNGALTLGENIGDLAGVTMAHAAYRISLGDEPDPEVDGLSGDQRFFESWARAWRRRYRDQEMIRHLSVNPHSPPEFRANIVRNLDQFYAAYGVGHGDGLWLSPEQRVLIW